MLDIKTIFNPDAIEAAVKQRYGQQRHRLALVKTPEDLPTDWRICFEERAAIREYLGGQPRQEAEEAALAETVAQMEASAGKTGRGTT